MSLDSSSRFEIESLAKKGELIDAIKLYREKTGCGLAQAKNDVEAIAMGKEVQPPFTSPTLTPEIQSALERGNKIEAIKLYRTAHNVDLATAKNAIESLAKNSGISSGPNQLPGVQKSGCFGLILFAAAIGVLIAREFLI